MTNFLWNLHDFIWGSPLLLLILGTGLFLSLRTGFVQLRLFPRAIRQFLSVFHESGQPQGVSPFQALCTALGATVGTGNLIGVAGAVCLGGPGAIFWMWVCAILGMAVKFAEVTLAIHFRIWGKDGYQGGPMQIITRGMQKKYHVLAYIYALFGMFAALGVGNATQINALVSGINNALAHFGIAETPLRNLGFGILLSLAVGAMLMGGVRRIGKTAEFLVPFMSAVYLLLCGVVLIARFQFIPQAFQLILKGAFSPRAVTGGILGSTLQGLRVGCSRGVFTNEAGMGTASMAHACASVNHPAEQGLLGIIEVFLDTIVICTMTALVILVSGVPIPYGVDAGGQLTSDAFSYVCGNWTSIFLAVSLCCFAFATVLGWGLYGARCAQFLFGEKFWRTFTLVQTAVVLPGALLKAETLWMIAEIINGLMALPNLIALAALSGTLRRLTIEYERRTGNELPVEVPYADFHQRKPL